MSGSGVFHYLLELTLVWSVLLGLYCTILVGTTSWAAQRRYLLFSYGLGIVLPALPVLYAFGPEVMFHVPAQLMQYMGPVTTVVPALTAEVTTRIAPDWLSMAGMIWGIGAVVSLVAILYRLGLHLRPRPLSVAWEGKYRIVRSKQVRAPYAVFNRIYLPGGMSAALERTAILHETAHLRHGHTYEQLLVLLGRCVLWFHPLAWAYAYQLSKVHEFEADAEVVETIPRREYAKQLLSATLSRQLVPGLFSSPLKARIARLTRELPRRRLNGMHYGLLLLVLTGLVMASTIEEREWDQADWFAAIDAHETSEPPRLTPRFASGDMWGTLIDRISQEVRYPAEAREAGEYGEVLLRVFIDRYGTMTYAPVPSAPAPDGEMISSLPIVVVGYSDGGQRNNLGTKTAGTSLAAEVERIADYLATLKWYPATDHDMPIDGSLYIYFTFELK